MADEKKCACDACPEDCSCRTVDPVVVKPSWFWIKDARGSASVTTTFTTIAFLVTTAAYVLSIAEKIGPVAIRPFDVGACSAFFVPLLTLYFGRRFTEAKFNSDAGKQ